MLLNRNILRESINPKTVQKIMLRVSSMNISEDRMARTVKNGLYPMVHFKKDDFVRAMEDRILNMREVYRPLNIKLLNLVKGIK